MAMSEFQLATLAQQYTGLVKPVVQQADSRTARSTEFKTGCVGLDIQVVDYVAKAQVRVINGDLTAIRDTVVDGHSADTRWLPRPSLVEHTDLFYTESQLLRLVDIKSSYRDATVKAFAREKDIFFMRAAVGSAIVSINNVNASGATPANIVSPYSTVALPAGNQYKASAGTTVADALKDIKRIFESMDVDLTTERPVVYMDSEFGRALLNDIQYITWTTSGMQPLGNGDYKDFLGFTFVMLSQDIFRGAGITDKAVVVCGKPVMTGIWEDVNTTIGIRHDKDDAYQVNTKMMLASTRLDEWRVATLDYSEIKVANGPEAGTFLNEKGTTNKEWPAMNA